MQTPETIEKVKRVAQRSLDICPCYGHFCEHCEEAKELLSEVGANDEPHYHKARYVNGQLTDECDRCGRDLRNPIHTRLGQEFPSDQANNPGLRIEPSTLLPILDDIMRPKDWARAEKDKARA
jgi:hypothetical protein